MPPAVSSTGSSTPVRALASSGPARRQRRGRPRRRAPAVMRTALLIRVAILGADRRARLAFHPDQPRLRDFLRGPGASLRRSTGTRVSTCIGGSGLRPRSSRTRGTHRAARVCDRSLGAHLVPEQRLMPAPGRTRAWGGASLAPTRSSSGTWRDGPRTRSSKSPRSVLSGRRLTGMQAGPKVNRYRAAKRSWPGAGRRCVR